MSDSTVTYDRSSGRFVENKQPQSTFANMGSQTPKAWYIEEMKRIQEQLSKIMDEAVKKDLNIRYEQIKEEMFRIYPR